MILSAVRKYFESCPYFEDARINADFLSEAPKSFGIYAEHFAPVLKTYASGDTLSQFVFSIRMRASYGRKISENEKISKLFYDIKSWIDTQKRAENFPIVSDDISVQDIEVLTGGHLKNTNAADCVYEMKCRIIYYKRR
ncbi:MAG: hypothetical protein IKB60_05670 [Clostridia bacterium]|nr:hypothetical protein [Clostridia bacterium]